MFLHLLSPHQEGFPNTSHLANSSSSFQVHLLEEALPPGELAAPPLSAHSLCPPLLCYI